MSEYKGTCSTCHEEEIYSHTLTPNECLNCYQTGQHEEQLAYMEAMHDDI